MSDAWLGTMQREPALKASFREWLVDRREQLKEQALQPITEFDNRRLVGADLEIRKLLNLLDQKEKNDGDRAEYNRRSGFDPRSDD